MCLQNYMFLISVCLREPYLKTQTTRLCSLGWLAWLASWLAAGPGWLAAVPGPAARSWEGESATVAPRDQLEEFLGTMQDRQNPDSSELFGEKRQPGRAPTQGPTREKNNIYYRLVWTRHKIVA